MHVSPITPSDVQAQWAQKVLLGSTTVPLDTTSINHTAWVNRLEETSCHPPLVEWVAFQALQGDTTNWQIASRLAIRDVIVNQFEQLAVYARNFLELTSVEKKLQHATLQRNLAENPLGAMRLEVFRPYLDLESLASLGVEPDVAMLIKLIISRNVAAPVHRSSSLQTLLDVVDANPDRWKCALQSLREKLPEIANAGEPMLRQCGLLNSWKESNQERKAFRSQNRFHILLDNVDRFKSKCFQLAPVLIFIGACLFPMGIWIANSISWNNERDYSAGTRMKPSSQQNGDLTMGSNKPSTIPTPKPGFGSTDNLLDGMIVQPNKYDALLALLKSNELKGLIESIRENWKRLAETKGMAGLDDYEEQLRRGGIRPTLSENDLAVQLSLDRHLRLFRIWREQIGDPIAKEVKPNE